MNPITFQSDSSWDNMSNLQPQQNFLANASPATIPSSIMPEEVNRISRPPFSSSQPILPPAILNVVRGHGHGHATGHNHAHGHSNTSHHTQQGGISLMNMQMRIPVPLPASGIDAAQPFVINVENPATSSGTSFLSNSAAGPNSSDSGVNQEPSQPGSLSSVKDVVKLLEGTLPFVILIFAKIMYDHRLGILIFVAMYGTFFHANSSLRKLIMQRDVHNSMDYLGNLVWIIGFLAANILFIYYVFDDQKLYRSLYFSSPEVGEMTVWNLLWIVGTTDFIIKYSTILLKALITALPRQVLPTRKKGKFYLLVEILSQFYRSLVPILPWVFFLEDNENGGRWFSLILLLAYMICKVADIFSRIKELRKGFKKFQSDLSYGTLPTRTQLESYDNTCPMCLDKFCDPIALNCKHIFCEECISKWFNQERTCPMCRANVIDYPQWRDGATSGNLQLW